MVRAKESAPRARPKRRWFQYSLRTLLLAITAAAIWLGMSTHRARQQEQAVDAILQLGGSVYYDYEYDSSRKRQAGAEPLGPKWLRTWVGEHYFVTAVAVDLGERQIDDAALEHLEPLRHLKTLHLYANPIGDAGLAHIQGLTALEFLILNETQLTDAGLVHLKGLTNLHTLVLMNTEVSDEGLVHLADLKSLEDLRLGGSKVAGPGLVNLQALSTLRVLGLRNTRVTEDHLLPLEALPNLEFVDLAGTAVVSNPGAASAGSTSTQQMGNGRNR